MLERLTMIVAAGGLLVALVAGPAAGQGSEADVSIRADYASAAIPGQVLVITVTVTNEGPWSAQQVVVGSVIPSQLSVIDVTATTGTCVGEFGSLLCSLPELDVGTETVTLTLEVGEAAEEQVVFTAFVQSFGTLDPILAGNSATITIPVVEVLASTGVETEVLLPAAIALIAIGGYALARTRRFGRVVIAERIYAGPQAISAVARFRWRPWE